MRDNPTLSDVLIGFVWTMKSLHIQELEEVTYSHCLRKAEPLLRVSGVPRPKVSKLTRAVGSRLIVSYFC